MKKKILLGIFNLFLLLSISAQGFKSITLKYDYEDSIAEIFYNEKEAYMVLPYVGEYAKLDKSVFFVDKDGYLKFIYKDTKYLIIDGDIFQFKVKDFYTDGEISYSSSSDFPYADKNLKEIFATSYLTEKVKGKDIKYSPDNLYKEVAYIDHTYSLNRRSIPWVEGKPDYGIGESITIEYKNTVSAISVLNGYVTSKKLKLYKENSRLKKVQIENLETGKKQYVEFEDKVYFTYIPLTEPTKKIKITIVDVYPGSKYSDTCVTAIIDKKREQSNWVDIYFNENKEAWHLESQETVLEDCFSGMDLLKSKYETNDFMGGM